MTSKFLVYISREMERKFRRNNRFGGEMMTSELDVVSWMHPGHLRLQEASGARVAIWAAGTN